MFPKTGSEGVPCRAYSGLGRSSAQQWVRSWEPPSQQSCIAASLTADAHLLTVGPVTAQEQQEHKEATDFHGMSS